MSILTGVAVPPTTLNISRKPLSHNGEQAFAKFLSRCGYKYAWEPVTFNNLPPIDYDGPVRSFTPDVQLLFAPGIGRLTPPIYLELTIADRIASAKQLSKRVLEKNRRFSHSKKPFIGRDEYLRLKRDKIDRAIEMHGVRVVLIGYYRQLDIYEDPSILYALIDEAVNANRKHLTLIS